MTQIVYTTKAQRFADDFQRELIASGIKELIAELQARLDRLESFELQPSTAPIVDIPKPRRKPGRPSKEKKSLEQVIADNPRLQALTSQLNKLTGNATTT